MFISFISDIRLEYFFVLFRFNVWSLWKVVFLEVFGSFWKVKLFEGLDILVFVVLRFIEWLVFRNG